MTQKCGDPEVWGGDNELRLENILIIYFHFLFAVVTDYSVVAGATGTLEASWEPVNNDSVEGYLLEYHRVSSSSMTSEEVERGAGSGKLSVTLMDLLNFTLYSVSVRVRCTGNENGLPVEQESMTSAVGNALGWSPTS